jgi:hypothetical protein
MSGFRAVDAVDPQKERSIEPRRCSLDRIESNGENEGNGMANGEEEKRKRTEVSSGLGFSGGTKRVG